MTTIEQIKIKVKKKKRENKNYTQSDGKNQEAKEIKLNEEGEEEQQVKNIT